MELRKHHTEIVINSGQHYDKNMADVFNEMKLPKPDYDLGVSSGSHGQQTAKILAEIEPILSKESPDYVLVFGDTNTTLAATLAASKQCMPVVHIEAGLRSFDRRMPEEQNRIVSDHLATILACPTQIAMTNLKNEGITNGVFFTGDLMFDSIKLFESEYKTRRIGTLYSNYSVLTLHRPSNVDNKDQLVHILSALEALGTTLIFPVHPRTRKQLDQFELNVPKNIQLIEPKSYLDMMALISNANGVFTDSGGMQKEAFFLNKKCVTLRDSTEWVETVNANENILALNENGKMDIDKIDQFLRQPFGHNIENPYGNGMAAIDICKCLSNEN